MHLAFSGQEMKSIKEKIMIIYGLLVFSMSSLGHSEFRINCTVQAPPC